MNLISIRKLERLGRWTKKKTLARRTEEQDPGSTYKTVMSKKGQAMNEGQDPGSTHIVANTGTSSLIPGAERRGYE